MEKKYHVLIVGAGSYVGESFREYCSEHYAGCCQIDTLDVREIKPISSQFIGYDTVFLVAGIAHRRENKKNAHLYYEVNRDLAVSVAESAKAAGVRQIVVMSSMAVYGISTGAITKHTKPAPAAHYGKSKLQADRHIWGMRDEGFKVAVLRSPMIYGKGCKGNYQRLRTLALHTPIFPKTSNSRSMLYIGNLCEFVVWIIREQKDGLFFPQNYDYVNTGEMVKAIAASHRKKLRLVPGFGWVCRLPISAVQKVFGSLTYEKVDIIEKFSFEESIRLTEQLVFFCRDKANDR